ncbi:MAG: PKD domain-containing protein [Lewinellaceae bacterium]|nr:PKD domain-containing protein [Lewinellaceae bacterium]
MRAQSNEGTEFWFGFMHHHDPGQNQMVAMITSKYSTSGVVKIPGFNWDFPFTVAANSVTIVPLPSYVENTSSEVVEGRAVQVISQLPASVYIHQYNAMRSEATVVLPVSSLGAEYYVMTYTGFQENNNVYPSEFLLIALEDETKLSIRVSDQTKGGKAAGETFDITLNAGQTYQVQSLLGSTGDLTGSHVTGNKKFNVLAGCRWTQVPAGCFFRDNLLEQMYPVSTWGRQFVTAPYANMPYDVFRVLASQDDTQITVQDATGTQQYILDAGKFVEYQRSVPTFVSADRPIAVGQYLIGSNCSGYPVGDPSMIFLNSIEQIRDTVTLYNSSFENITENYIAVITKTVDVPLTTFDGQPLTDLSNNIQTAGPNGEFSFARLNVKTGAHTIISQGCGVIATAYGYGYVESYAYAGGASFKPLNAQSLIPEGGCLNDTLYFDTKLPEPRYSFLWDLGDGTTSTKGAFSHVYSQLGTFNVTLYLTDNCLDLHDTLTRPVLVTLRQAVTVAGDADVCEGKTVQLGATDLPGARFEWRGPNGFFQRSNTRYCPVRSPPKRANTPLSVLFPVAPPSRP